MSTISLTLPAYKKLHEGQTLTFRAPGDSEDCTVLKINGTEYSFLDSLGKSVLESPGFFVGGAMLSTTVDLANHRLYLQDSSTLHVTSDICESLDIEDTSTLDTALCSIKGGGPEFLEVSGCIEDSTSYSISLPVSSSYIAYGNGIFVSSKCYSTDGINWVENDIGGRPLFVNDKFIVLTNWSTGIKYSTDGINWQTITTDIGYKGWYDACYGNNTYVIIAGGNIGEVSDVVASSDSTSWTSGMNWTQGTLPSADWRSVCYGNGKFVAVATTTIAYSTDGINWTEGNMPANTNMYSVCYGNGKFVVGGSKDYYSTDGINWTYNPLPITVRALCYDNGMFVAVGYSYDMAYSKDGINWTKGTLSNTNSNTPFVCCGNGMFIIVFNTADYSVVIPINFSLGTSEGIQILFKAPSSLTNIDINGASHDIVYSDGSIIDSSEISEGSIVSLLLDPEDNKAYLL